MLKSYRTGQIRLAKENCQNEEENQHHYQSAGADVYKAEGGIFSVYARVNLMLI